MARVGFIGLGNIGFPMARRLVGAGHDVVAYDVRAERVRELVGDGGVGRSPSDVAARSDIVVLSLPTPDVLREVVGGEEGLAASTGARLVIDLSTVGPDAAREADRALGAAGISYLDCPVSGGVPGAEKGTLAIMVAGTDEAFDRARPILETIGKPIRVGDTPGQGQAVKLLNNFLSATAMAATAEAVVLGVKAGLDPAVMLDVFNASSGRNTATADKFPRSVLDRSFDYGFRTVLLHKDVRLCARFAEGLGAAMTVVPAVDRVWEEAAAALGDRDFTRIVEVVEAELGVTVGKAAGAQA